MKEIIDIVHKSIYPFFDVCEDGKEEPLSDKDKLLLNVNKAICSNLKALEQETYGDCISKQEVLHILKEKWNMFSDADDAMQESIDTIEALPPITPQTKQELYEDAISRKAVIKHICEEKFCYEENCKGVLFNRCMDITWVNELPSVSSSEKPNRLGQWIEHFDESGKWYECDQCHTDWGGAVNFCPNCGAKMSEIPTGSEGSEKE